MVLSQVKLPNLDCWGPGESIDTHIVGVWNKKGKVTSSYPRCTQCPGGPESARNVKSWLWGSRGVHWYTYYPVSKENFLREILANFCYFVCFYIRCKTPIQDNSHWSKICISFDYIKPFCIDLQLRRPKVTIRDT